MNSLLKRKSIRLVAALGCGILAAASLRAADGSSSLLGDSMPSSVTGGAESSGMLSAHIGRPGLLANILPSGQYADGKVSLGSALGALRSSETYAHNAVFQDVLDKSVDKDTTHAFMKRLEESVSADSSLDLRSRLQMLFSGAAELYATLAALSWSDTGSPLTHLVDHLRVGMRDSYKIEAAVAAALPYLIAGLVGEYQARLIEVQEWSYESSLEFIPAFWDAFGKIDEGSLSQGASTLLGTAEQQELYGLMVDYVWTDRVIKSYRDGYNNLFATTKNAVVAAYACESHVADNGWLTC